MALKAGRRGLNKKLVDLRGNLKNNFIAPKWKRNHQYTKDNYVMFEGDLYKALVNHRNIVPSADDGSHWEKVSVASEIGNIKDTLLSMSEIKRQIMQANATTLFDIPDDWKVALIIASKQAGNTNYLSYKMALYSIVSDNYATLSTISQHNDRSEDVYNITELSINDNNKKQLKCSNGTYGGTLVISAIRIL